MTNETKFIIGAFAFTLLVIVGLAFFISFKEKKVSQIPTNTVLGMESTPGNYDLGNVPINGGVVTKEYEVKNTSGKGVQLLKIATSCMCTTASVRIGEKETRFFSMEMTGDANPFLDLKLKNGDSAKVSVKFDPAAHGPAGVGAFDRIVWLYFDTGVKELTFKGVVVK